MNKGAAGGNMAAFSPIVDKMDCINFPWKNYCNINLNEWWCLQLLQDNDKYF